MSKLRVYTYEADIVGHCNFRCVGCSHLSPLRSNEIRQTDELARDLEHLSAISEATKFILIGGEPTLHPDLEGIVRVVKLSGIAPLLEMWTNGSQFGRVSDSVLEQLDSIVMNRYPGKVTDAQVAEIQARCAQFDVALQIDAMDSFYLNLTDKPRSDIVNLFRSCPYQTHCFSIKGGYLFRCPQSSVIPKYVMGLDENIDGVALEGLTVEGLSEFLTSQKPRAACVRCARQEEWKPWKEAPRAEWLNASMREMPTV